MVASPSGCSFALVSRPPPHHEELPAFDSTESRVAPVLDTLFTALEVTNFAVAAGSTGQQWSDTFNGNPPLNRGTAAPALHRARSRRHLQRLLRLLEDRRLPRGPRSREEASAGAPSAHRPVATPPPAGPGVPPGPRRSPAGRAAAARATTTACSTSAAAANCTATGCSERLSPSPDVPVVS